MSHVHQGRSLAAARAAGQLGTMRGYAAMSGRGSCFPALADWIAAVADVFGLKAPAGNRGLFRSFAQ